MSSDTSISDSTSNTQSQYFKTRIGVARCAKSWFRRDIILSVPLLLLLTVFATVSFGKVYEILPFTGEVQLQDARNPISSEQSVAFGESKLKVSFYNIEMFTDGIKDGNSRKETAAKLQAQGAAEIIDDLAADIILISEVENERILGILNDNLKVPYEYGYISEFGSGSGRSEKMNIGVLSRVKPDSVKELDFGLLVGTGRPTRGFLRTVIALGDDSYLVLYATHLKSNWGKKQKNYSQRANSMSILLNDVAKLYEEYPDRNWEFMLLGDFNTDPLLRNLRDDPTLKVLPHWSDLWSEQPNIEEIHTVPTRFGDRRREFPPALFDRILVHPSLKEKPWIVGPPKVVPVGTVPDVNVKPGQDGHVSDHYPIYIEIQK